jgi:hypothetical protein
MESKLPMVTGAVVWIGVGEGVEEGIAVGIGGGISVSVGAGVGIGVDVGCIVAFGAGVSCSTGSDRKGVCVALCSPATTVTVATDSGPRNTVQPETRAANRRRTAVTGNPFFTSSPLSHRHRPARRTLMDERMPT